MEDISYCKCPHCGGRLAYEVQMISAVEILKAMKGALGVAPAPIQRTYERELHRNRQLIVNFINDKGKEGWEFIGSFNYESIPYRGAMVFRRPKQFEYEDEIGSVKDYAEEPEDKEKIFETIRKNRQERKQTKGRLVDHKVRPKPEVKTSKVDEDDKDALRAMFEQEYAKAKPLEAPDSHKQRWNEIEKENEIMLEKERENEEKNLEKLNKEIKKKLKESGKNVRREISVNNLEKIFEDSHAGKHAVYRGRETNAFKQWRENYLRSLSENPPAKEE